MSKRYQVLNVLHPTIWKSALEIRDEINLPLGTIHICLHGLEDQGLVTSRLREIISPDRLALRGGRGEKEYKLTEEGLKRRVERKHEEGFYVPVPNEA